MPTFIFTNFANLAKNSWQILDISLEMMFLDLILLEMLSGEIMIRIGEKASFNEQLPLKENNSSTDIVKNDLDKSILGKYKL